MKEEKREKSECVKEEKCSERERKKLLKVWKKKRLLRMRNKDKTKKKERKQ